MLDDAGLGVIDRFTRFCAEWFADNGFDLSVETDMHAWVALLRTAPRNAGINPSFDPAWSFVTPQNCFWLRVRHRGREVACSANRLFLTDDYVGLMRSLKLWYDLKPALLPAPITVTAPRDAPPVAGRVGHSGGLWVHPDMRKRGFAAILPRLIRALSLRHFEEDWHTTLVTHSMLNSGLPREAYGYTRLEPCVVGFFPPTGTIESIYTGLIDRRDLLAQLAEEPRWLPVPA